MPVSVECPEIGCWQGLLGDTIPPEQRERYEQHLECCPTCQERLDHFEEYGGGLVSLVRQVGARIAAEPETALTEVIQRLQGATAPADSLELYFLGVAQRPGDLGTLGDYQVEEVIGQGGMGIVFRAYEPALQRRVAIKVLSPALAGSITARKRFIREAKAAAAVCHEHIVAVHGVHEVGGFPYLVMHYVAGESLQDRLNRAGPLELTEIVRIGMETAKGLAAAHALGLIHRDIKPANLLLEGEPGPVRAGSGEPGPVRAGSDPFHARVKITDFGLARMVDDVGLTQTGVVTGTPEYMAPEQACGEPVDHRADLFSLGSVLYAMCTELPPFRSNSALAVLHAVCETEPAPIRLLNPNVPVWLETLIMRLLAKRPAERIQSTAEVASLLEGYLAHLHQPATVPPPELPTQPGKPRPSRFWLVLLALFVILGMSGFLLAQADLPQGQSLRGEIYQDFRGNRPLHPSLKMIGPNLDLVTRQEDQGLRITLKDRESENWPVGVMLTSRLSGDFEITGTYELLSATRPTKGFGVGVSLSVRSDGKRRLFAKIGRLLLPESHHTAKKLRNGSGYSYEYWNNEPPTPPKIYRANSVESDAKSGQIRMIREGDIIRFLVADGSGNSFTELHQGQFSKDDLGDMQFIVADSGTPGNEVDARLVDLRIRSGNLIPQKPADSDPSAKAAEQAVPRGWLLAVEVLVGLGVALALIVLSVWLYVRRRRTLEPSAARQDNQGKTESAPQSISFSCSHCGKKIKAQGMLAGKKARCPQCGEPVLVPEGGPAVSSTHPAGRARVSKD